MALSGEAHPSTLVLFGVTGDLAARKILPALWRLYRRGALPALWSCVGVSRRDWSDKDLRTYIGERLVEVKPSADFLNHFVYQRADFNRLADYRRLAERLGRFDDGWRTCANKLFYLAVPPEMYEPLLSRLDRSGLTAPCGSGEGWTRVIVEKPFGRDEQTARHLDELLGRLFREEQIYRIDHYLGKELAQNILAFRFANRIWQGSWDSRSIERIDIKVWESGLVEPGRADTYDAVGALRDVGQNHLLQLLALLTMDDPGSLAAGAVRDRRSELLARLGAVNLARSWRAQYQGYRELDGVKNDSSTETFFHLETSLDKPEWRGVAIALESGKGLPSATKEAVVTFRSPQSCYCDAGPVEQVSRVVFRLEPDEGITISFWAKKPGVTADIELKNFSWQVREEAEDYGEPYERLLLDCFLGNQSLFVSTPEVRAGWRLVDPVVRSWRRVDSRSNQKLLTYRPGVEPARPRVAVERPGERPNEIGLIGLGKMGAGLAENLLDDGWRVAAWNRTAEVTERYAARGLVAADSPADLMRRLKAKRRVVWLMLPAGPVVDDLIFGTAGLARELRAGDILIDGGNSQWQDTKRRAARLRRRGVLLLDVGVSGGPAGARWGASLMIGGDEATVEWLTPLWRSLAQDGRAFQRVGSSGAGHYAKMVHNAIEYGFMQSLAEGAAIWERGPYRHPLADLLELYNQGSVIESRLVGWLAEGWRQVGGEMNQVDGRVEQTGEARWAVKEAERLGQVVPATRAALTWRRRSMKHPNLVGQYLALMRGLFGGHRWRKHDE